MRPHGVLTRSDWHKISGMRVAVGLILGTCVLAWAIPAARAADGPAAGAPAADRKTVVITLAGEIDDYNRDQLFRRFDDAKKLGAKVVILNIDTYGGLLTSGLEISRFVKRQEDLHVVAYVKDKAISAGAMIAMACDEIVVSDSATLGDWRRSSSGPRAWMPCPPRSGPRPKRRC